MAPSETMIAAINRKVLLQHATEDHRPLGLVPRTLLTQSQSSSSRRIADKRHERSIALHDALAELLVHEERPESVAIASSFSAQGLKIFIASDKNKDLDLLETRLRQLWNRLREVKRIYCGIDRSNPEEIQGIREKQKEFRRFIYEYSWTKLVQRCEKYKDSCFPRFFEEVLDKSNEVIESLQGFRYSYVLTEELEAIGCLREVCQLTDGCKTEDVPGVDGLNNVVLSIMRLNRLISGKKDAVDRWGFVSRVIAGADSKESLPTFIEKICSIERSIREVLHLSHSSHRRAILDANLDTILVTIQPVSLEYDLLNDSSISKVVEESSMMAQIFRSAWTKSSRGSEEPWKLDAIVYPHCECALLAYLVSSDQVDANGADSYGFIGSSKSWCTACWLYFSTYNNVADKYGLSKFHVSKPHAEVYSPWSKPALPDGELGSLVETHLYAQALDALWDTLKQEQQNQEEHIEYAALFQSCRETHITQRLIISSSVSDCLTVIYDIDLAGRRKDSNWKETGLFSVYIVSQRERERNREIIINIHVALV